VTFYGNFLTPSLLVTFYFLKALLFLTYMLVKVKLKGKKLRKYPLKSNIAVRHEFLLSKALKRVFFK